MNKSQTPTGVCPETHKQNPDLRNQYYEAIEHSYMVFTDQVADASPKKAELLEKEFIHRIKAAGKLYGGYRTVTL